MSDSIIIYAEILVDCLRPGVNRPSSWYDDHPEFIEMRDRLIKEFNTIGMKNPLSCVDDRQDGTFVVTVGNQRLEALKYGDFKIAPCIISFLKDKSVMPKNSIEIQKDDIQKYFDTPISRIVLKHSVFQIVPSDTNEYDPHKQEYK